jgi:hypothetical protein
MTMPGDITFLSHTSYFGANLTAYVNNGTISESRVDDMGMGYFLSFFDRISHRKFSHSDPCFLVPPRTRFPFLPADQLRRIQPRQ